ncbi:hypothetical protein LCGC14_0320060 [marine sediment metagenome]|uniref:Uncharacterized protein n=1 Tax=marine sediment metagenome TaxID=412755 RepID=A0A0F9WRL2_9ZZZZ
MNEPEKLGMGIGAAGHYDERGEMVIDSFSIVDPSCMRCHIDAGGGYTTAMIDLDGSRREIAIPKQHAIDCPKR